MILSIFKERALTFILAVTSLLDGIRALLHVDKDLLFESLVSSWIQFDSPLTCTLQQF